MCVLEQFSSFYVDRGTVSSASTTMVPVSDAETFSEWRGGSLLPKIVGVSFYFWGGGVNIRFLPGTWDFFIEQHCFGR